MKKTIIISILTILVLFSSCGKRTVDEPIDIEPKETNSVYYEETATKKITEASLELDITQEKSTDDINTKKHVSTTNSNGVGITSQEPPYASYFTLEQLKNLKNACETMDDEELNKYILESRNLRGSSICDRKTALEMLKAIENTTVVLLDGNKSNFYEIHYHDQRHYISQPVIMSETRNLVCTYYTNLSEENVKTHHENTEYITYFTDITANGVTANVYVYPNGTVDEFYAEMFVDGTRITYRVTEEQTIEEFEADFARLEFVKIGDLLNETTAEVTTAVETTIPETEAQITE